VGKSQAAPARYVAQRDELYAGRVPRPLTAAAPALAGTSPATNGNGHGSNAATLRDLVNHLLTAKKRRLDGGEMGKRAFSDYHAACRYLVEGLGVRRQITDLTSSDFGMFRAELAKTRGPVALGNQINRVRSIFKYGCDAGLLDKPIRFGPEFVRPPMRAVRLAKQAKGARLFERTEIQALLKAASPALKAMILLGINCGLGNTDIAELPISAVNLKKGALEFPRPKTAILRRCMLWPETVQAIKAYMKERKAPADEADTGILFITKYGQRWVRVQEPGERSKGKTKAVLDHAACLALAQLIAEARIPEDREETTLPGIARPSVANFYLALVAICHQTSPRGRPPLQGRCDGQVRRGWDYLLARFEAVVCEDPSLVEPKCWASIRSSDLSRIFHDPEFGDTLSDVEGRAALLRDLGLRLLDDGVVNAESLYERSDHRVASEDPNLLALLGRYHAYRDPVRKKSLFFLSLMRNHGLWVYRDDQLLGPPVDYHEVRGRLRIGTVRLVDPALLTQVRACQPVTQEQDIVIRQAVYGAIMLMAQAAGLSPSRLHYLFWQVFRTICTRLNPACYSLHPDMQLPSRYVHLTIPGGTLPRCPFSSLCASAGSSTPLLEHIVDTDFY
jgi:integrase